MNFFKCSDHIAFLKAFKGYKDAKCNESGRTFCWEVFPSLVTLQMMEDMRNQFIDLLSDIGFVDKSRGASVSSLSYLFFLSHINLFCVPLPFPLLFFSIAMPMCPFSNISDHTLFMRFAFRHCMYVGSLYHGI